MFTGLIEAVCRIKTVGPTAQGQGLRLQVALESLATGTHLGDSIAINGACLTVTQLQGENAWFDVSPESLNHTTLGSLRVGDQVNVERALCVGDRLGGHFVQGHVDGHANIKSIHTQGDFLDITFSADTTLLQQIVPKGSVAINGISLTVATLDKQGFSVAVIPETARQTTLNTWRSGDVVNIETDLLIKAVLRTCRTWMDQNRSLTADKLKRFGF